MIEVPEIVLKVWMKDVKKRLHRYWDHPEYDDIVAEAYMTMWEALSRADAEKVRDVHGYAMRAAWLGAQAFLGGPRNGARTWNIFKKTPVTPLLSLDGVIAGHYEEWTPRRMIEPDFVPALIERLVAEAVLSGFSPARQTVILLCAYHGLTRWEACEQLGWSRNRIDYYLQGVSRQAIPYAHPGPGAPKNWPTRQRDERGCFR